jgi:ribosome-associated protein
MSPTQFEDTVPEYDGPSKSEKKRQAEHMQNLGKELTELGAETLAKIDLPEVILKEIKEFHKLRSFGAKRRQLQLIGKYMRSLDGDAVRTAIDRATGNDKTAVAALHRSEHLRDALIAEDNALESFIADFPEADIQQVRSLIRNARKEKENNKPPKSSRELYRLIYALVLPPLSLYPADDDEESEDDE